MSILIATGRVPAWADFAAVLAKETGEDPAFVASASQAVEAVHAAPPELVVVDETLPGGAPGEVAMRVLSVNALVNTALVSALDDEAYEGLGVLMRLDPGPDPAQARELLQRAQALG